MKNAEFSWKGTFMVFWAIVWRNLVVGIPLVIVFSSLAGGIAALLNVFAGMHIEYASLGFIVGQIVMTVTYLYVLKRLFTKGFGRYHLAVLEKDPTDEPPSFGLARARKEQNR